MGARPAVVQRSAIPVAAQANAQQASAHRAGPATGRRAIDGVLSRKMSTLLPLRVQAQMQVSSAGDPAEREADATARRVVAMALPAERTVSSPFHVDRLVVQRKPAGPATADDDAAAEIRSSLGGGGALAPSVRKFMEPRFKADFSGVRVHTDSKAAGLAARLSARAFAFGKHVFFGRGEYQPDTPGGKELLAHELTHTIQQRAVVQRQEAAPTVTQSTAPRIQRFGMDTVRDYIADKANIIPGFRLFTIVIGVNPINMAAVDPSPANILRAAIEFIPGGGLVTQALDNSGVFEKVANWAAQQIRALASLGGALIQALKDFLKSLGVSDFARPGATWDRARGLFSGPIDQVRSTVKGWLIDIVEMIKDAILKPIGKLAEGTPAYPLLKALLGKDPVTGQDAPFDGDAVVGGLMSLAGQDEIWGNVKKANAVPRVVAWFQGAKGKLVGFVKQIPSLVIAAFKSLELSDIILVPLAFIKIGKVFGGFVGDFVSWALDAGWKLLEIVFDVVSPGAWGYIQKTGAALKSILKNPLPFLGNLVKAAKLGFTNFADHFLTHLKAGLLDWLVGSLPGVYIPKALSLAEFGKLALSVFGISWAQIRGKIVKALGPSGETIMKGLETAFDVVKALVTGGPAAAWEVIKEKLSALKDTIVDGVIGFIKDTVVQKAIPKLIAMFIPGAGFISAILSIYDTVMVFVEKISKIIAVVTAFINSIVAIASGNIGAAAAKVESILAGLLSLAISFLAGFVGLGKVADKIRGVIDKVRDKVDKALDAAIAWIIAKAKSLFASLFGKKEKGKKAEGPGDAQRPRIAITFAMGTASHELTLDPKGGADPQVEMASGAPSLFEKKQRDAYNGIEYFKQYMSSITEAQVRREYETKLKPLIDAFQPSNVDAFKAVYKAKFPGKNEGPAISDADAKGRAAVVAKEAEDLLAKLKNWGATSGIPDLAKDAVTDTLQKKGQAIWKAAWEARIKQVEAAIASVTYQGVKLDYRGSLKKGYRGEQKNLTRFNPSDFDVDLYVVHPSDFDAAVKAGAEPIGGQIFPNNKFAPAALAATSRAAANALRTALPGVPRAGTSNVSLRREGRS